MASAAWIGATVVWWRRRLPNPGGVTPGPGHVAAAIVSSVVIAERFHAEVGRVEAYQGRTPDEGAAAA